VDNNADIKGLPLHLFSSILLQWNLETRVPALSFLEKNYIVIAGGPIRAK